MASTKSELCRRNVASARSKLKGRMMLKAEIDYGSGIARVYGNFPETEAIKAFYKCANDMFGIRKSISRDTVLSVEEVKSLPEPWDKMKDAAMVLEHNCGGPGWAFKDVAVWNSKHEKIKSEWD